MQQCDIYLFFNFGHEENKTNTRYWKERNSLEKQHERRHLIDYDCWHRSEKHVDVAPVCIDRCPTDRTRTGRDNVRNLSNRRCREQESVFDFDWKMESERLMGAPDSPSHRSSHSREDYQWTHESEAAVHRSQTKYSSRNRDWSARKFTLVK